MLIPFFKYLKSILTNLKIPGTIVLLIPFFQIFKIPETIFQIFKKHTYKILKKPSTIFCSYPFSNIKKSIFTNLKKTCHNFLLIPFFKYLKSILTNLKIPGTIVLLIPFFQIFKIPETIFQIFKKHTYKILKKPSTIFCSYPFSSI